MREEQKIKGIRTQFYIEGYRYCFELGEFSKERIRKGPVFTTLANFSTPQSSLTNFNPWLSNFTL
jgi:hypothetical protein